MKLLFDQNLSFRLCQALADLAFQADLNAACLELY
jgi:predicted nuclease of predicted toxin-antitoxin system